MVNKRGNALLKHTGGSTLAGRNKLILTSPSPIKVRGNDRFIKELFLPGRMLWIE
jgi:hypothetical protein